MKPFEHMDAEEIISSYNNAVKKKDQVGILADLNDIDKKVMAQFVQQADEAEPPAPDQGAKADAGKPRLSLVPVQIIYDVAAVREYGCKKYPTGGKDNWKQVDPERYRDAAFRHFLQYIRDPKSVDEESGLLHRQHLECNLAFLAELEGE